MPFRNSSRTWLLLVVLVLGSKCGEPGSTSHPPEVVLSAPTYCDLGDTIPLDGSATIDLDGDIIRYRFIFGDGTDVIETTIPFVQHSCRVSGLMEVQLEVWDAHGNMGSARKIISVRRP